MLKEMKGEKRMKMNENEKMMQKARQILDDLRERADEMTIEIMKAMENGYEITMDDYKEMMDEAEHLLNAIYYWKIVVKEIEQDDVRSCFRNRSYKRDFIPSEVNIIIL